jgi:hypothetical protein
VSYTLISTQTVGAGGAASIDFTSIPQTYTDLIVVFSLRGTVSAGVSNVKLTFNGSTTGYSGRTLMGFGSGAGYSETNVDQYSTPWPFINLYANVGSTSTASTFSNGSLLVPNYTGSANKSVSIDWVNETNATAAWSGINAGLWSNTSAITSLSLGAYSGNFVQYSTASLYGINRIPTATLGTTPTVDYLVVAGGGTGGGYVGGGGGAGGLLTGSAFSVASGSPITITVGAGGAGGAGSVSNGSSSTFSSVTAVGGGRGGQGGGGGQGPATSGGSGGGGGSSTASPSTLVGGAGTSGQGFAGGNSGGMGGSYPSGGGGGAAAVGVSPASTSTGGGNGGAGAVSTLTGTTMYYAGGGGGANSNASVYLPGTGGLGGGGNGALHSNADGSVVTPATAGLANTGGGGGGGGSAVGSGSSNTSLSGGSGVVIIRYPDTYNPPSATTGSPSVKYINGYRVYTWTASGSITF